MVSHSSAFETVTLYMQFGLNSLQETGVSDLTQAEIQEAVNSANYLADQHRQSKYYNTSVCYAVEGSLSKFKIYGLILDINN